MSHKPKILVIRQLALGDVLLTTPIIKQLYFDYDGDCEIDVLTMKPEAFINNPFVFNIYTPDSFLDSKKIYQKTINLDLVYEWHPNLHILEAYAKYSHGTIDKIKDKQIGIFPTLNDKFKIKKLIEDVIKGNYLTIHMRKDTWPSRNLSEDFWKSIVEGLLETTEYNIVQVGSDHEIAFNQNPRVFNLLGQLSLQELKVLFENSKCYIGIDSGTLHVAASTEVPIVSAFTSAHHQFRQPLGRREDSVFIPVTPDIDCYGCQSRMDPPITGVICTKGDPYSPPCRNLISKTIFIKAVIAACVT